MSAPGLEAMRAYLAADSAVSALVGTRVFGLELPPAESASMPRKAIVLSLAGGPGSRDYIRITDFRVDVFNYGGTPIEALQVQRASHDALKSIRREEQIISGSGALLYRANDSGGPIWLRDPDGNWPLVLESWLVLASDVVTT